MKFEAVELKELEETAGICDRVALIATYLEDFLRENKLHISTIA